MDKWKRIIFVGRSGTSREPMAMGILRDISHGDELEVFARGLIVSFPEPINGKAEAVLISNGIILDHFVSRELSDEDIKEGTLILTMERKQREKVLAKFKNASMENVYVLTDFVGDELEVINPYGGSLQSYGLCYESLRKSIKKLVKIIN